MESTNPGEFFYKALFCVFLRSIGRKKVFFTPTTFLTEVKNATRQNRRIERFDGDIRVELVETVRMTPNVAQFDHNLILFLLSKSFFRFRNLCKILASRKNLDDFDRNCEPLFADQPFPVPNMSSQLSFSRALDVLSTTSSCHCDNARSYNCYVLHL